MSMKYLKISFALWIAFFFLVPNFVFSSSIALTDKLSQAMIILLMVVSLVGGLSKISFFSTKNKMFNCLMGTTTLVILSFALSTNILWMFIFFEISVFPIFFMVSGWGYQLERIQASYYLFLYTSMFSFPFFLFLFNLSSGKSLFLLSKVFYQPSTLLFFSSIGLFLVKSPVYFIHLWLPKAHVESPVMGSILLAGVLLKLGGFGLIRILLVLATSKKMFFSLFFASLLGGLTSNIICFLQSDQKAMVAYMSVGHMSILVTGLLSGIFLSIKTAVLVMFVHAFISPAMFFMSFLFFNNSENRLITLNQSLLPVSFGISVLVIFFLLLNFSIPPFPPFFSELVLLFSMLSVWKTSFFAILSLVFLGCLYSIFILINSIHGKPLLEACFNSVLPNFFILPVFFFLLISALSFSFSMFF